MITEEFLLKNKFEVKWSYPNETSYLLTMNNGIELYVDLDISNEADVYLEKHSQYICHLDVSTEEEISNLIKIIK